MESVDKRFSSVEDMMHTNEMTFSNILGRLQEVEVSLSQSIRNQASGEATAALNQEVNSTKQRLELIERSWRTSLQKLEDELHTRTQQTGTATEQRVIDVCITLVMFNNFLKKKKKKKHKQQQAKSEITELKQHITDVASDIRKVDAAVNEEARQTRQVEHDAKWAIDGIKEQFAVQRDQMQQHQQRIEGVMSLVTMEAQEREALAASIKQAFESSIHGLSDQVCFNNINVNTSIGRFLIKTLNTLNTEHSSS